MGLFLKILIYLNLFAGALCVHQMSWLSCPFMDEHVFVNKEGHTETQLIHREAMLQFGKKGDAPVNPNAITFLLTGAKMDLRRHVEGAEADDLECELHRFSTEGIHVPWPGQEQGTPEYNRWFTCTLKHSKGLFMVTGFLRLPSTQAPSGQNDYRNWAPIEDREILTTTVAMTIKTTTPTVKARLGSQQKLHCQFAVDHKSPNITVDWHWQHRGERNGLFGYNSRAGKQHGSGVGLRGLAGGDASYTLPHSKMTSEGTYVCSVAVNPLFAHLDINLHIEEPPRVSINVGPVVSLVEDEDQKVICDAEGYYPLDVEMVWYEQDRAAIGQRVGAPLPKARQNVLLSSHKHNNDKTFSLSAFFYLKASLQDSGKQFTCSVSHHSLRVPIKKSFILNVQEAKSWTFILTVGFVVVTVLVIAFEILRRL